MKRKTLLLLTASFMTCINVGCDSDGNFDLQLNGGGSGGYNYDIDFSDTLLGDCYLNPEIYDYAVFKTGTYWIYESIDSAGKASINHVSVIQYRHDTLRYNWLDSYNRECVSMVWKHTNKDLFIDVAGPTNTQSVWTIAGNDSISLTNCTTNTNVTKIPLELSFGVFFSYPYKNGENKVYGGPFNNGTYDLINTRSIELKGETIPSIHTRSQNGAQIWISPGVGITRFITKSGTDWRLTDYNVVQ